MGSYSGNNIFTVDIISGKETQLTFDGSDVILNGKFDWVYEEEFSIIDGWEWSPDNKTIAFWRLDQSNVPEYKIPTYDSLYMNFIDTRYPLPGSKNSLIKIGAVDVQNGRTEWMDLGENEDIYIPRIKFTANANLLSIQKLNRAQNDLQLLFFDIHSGKANLVLEEQDSCWIDIYDDLTFLPDGKHFLWSSDKDGFHHIYYYDYSGKLLNQVTEGKWEVKELLGVDEKNQTVYYTSNERGRLYDDFYSVKLDGSNEKRITESAGDHEINLAPDSKSFIDIYSNANTMPATILYKSDGEKLRELVKPDMTAFESFQLPDIKFFTFTTSDGVKLDAYMIKPVNFDESKRYPVLIENYNGRGHQSIIDTWGRGNIWERMLTQKDFIVMDVDCRITGGRGKSYKKLAYRNLRKWEVNDLVETVNYLKTLPYIDNKNVGIWGWSYGGYTSALTILKASEYFKPAIAVAPVTHWKYYDDIYTERYMSTPELNPEGYQESAPLNYADRLKGKFLLIHGTADDNVHFQNSVELTDRLIQANKQFSVMFYPGKESWNIWR